MRVIRTSFIIVFCIVGALFLAYQGVYWMVQNNKKEQYAELVSFFDSQEVRSEIEQVIKSEDPHAFTESGVIKKYELDYDSMGVRTGRSIRVLINDDPSLNIGVKYIFMNNKWQMSIVTVSYELQILLESKE
ncbi:DUF1310 family protein [Abiotrophia sp.]|uniref:DUF1310 family protein n=1 Tax=Abiotrophia sp. TaxID=76631 RepID=UPI001CB0DD8B|nr:DUF1310 family protein [Abiotrophia sp.]MBF0941097.1 DUF1310 family protein [Abiotrophia sp.]